MSDPDLSFSAFRVFYFLIFNFYFSASGVPTNIQPHGQLSPAKDAMKRRVT